MAFCSLACIAFSPRCVLRGLCFWALSVFDVFLCFACLAYLEVFCYFWLYTSRPLTVTVCHFIVFFPLLPLLLQFAFWINLKNFLWFSLCFLLFFVPNSQFLSSIRCLLSLFSCFSVAFSHFSYLQLPSLTLCLMYLSFFFCVFDIFCIFIFLL